MRPRLGIESSWWAGGRQGSGGQLGTRQPSALASRGHSNHSVSGEQQLCRHCLSVQLLPDAGSIIVHLASFPFLRCFFLISFFLILPSQNGFSWWMKQFNFEALKKVTIFCLYSLLFKITWLLFSKWCIISEISHLYSFLHNIDHLPQLKKVTILSTCG